MFELSNEFFIALREDGNIGSALPQPRLIRSLGSFTRALDLGGLFVQT